MKALDSIKKALDYIEEHLTEDFRIDELAANCFLSPFYFQRLFRSVTGHSVEQYIKARRLKYSTELLKQDKQINEVALSCGFKSSEHFSRVFKEIYKITPSDYKKDQPPLYHVYRPDVILSNAKLDIGDKYISDRMLLQIQVREIDERKISELIYIVRLGLRPLGLTTRVLHGADYIQ